MTCPVRPSVVPYIAAWSTEEQVSPDPVRADRLRFPGEPDGLAQGEPLWLRRALRQGHGRPLYGRVHPQRQRRAMRALLCQVCGGPADRDERGWLWLLPDGRADWAGWPDGLMTVFPPVCGPCAPVALRECPQLAAGCVAVRVGRSEVCGVYGARYWPDPQVPPTVGVVEDDDPGVRWVLATQLLRSLSWCTVVELPVA
ncbi:MULTISPECIES: hypothetical protein [Streptomyces]|uniref:Phage protein n=1 Tax=Streptomyces flavovirens TaxID=52258 RepID=A0ABV8NDF3_9ACTN|nr:hypothetical protein [Streptomyces sp. MBT51]MBK3592417.1 hypothetical protein [Streptomyces sp. MBT51]